MKEVFNKKNKISPIYVISFALLFTPFFFVGIAIIIVYVIFTNIKKSNLNGLDTSKAPDSNNRPYNRIKRHTRVGDDEVEKMTNEDRKRHRHYSEIKNSYEQTVKVLPVRSNNTERCEVCKTVQSKPGTHCEICGELFGEGVRCGFCKCKNELYATHCKNCGVKFER